jgi:HD-GYP domain-containing protein (c-di-GMP phosphodiesterase class II)
MSSQVSHRVIYPHAGGIQLGGQAPTPERCRPAPRLVASSNARAASWDSAGELLKRLKPSVKSLMNEVRLGKAIDQDRVLPVVGAISDSLSANASALLSLARIKAQNERTYLHAIAVCALMVNFGRQMQLDDDSVRELGMAGLLHDIGEIGLPPSLLERHGKLTEQEMVIIRTHPSHGCEQLKRVPNLPEVVIDVCLHHHERVDGKGYPVRRAGGAISPQAKMAGICDVYDAISSDRPYREAWAPPECIASMFSWTGHFDESLLAHFIKSVGIYPVGSLVRLASDHLAIVLEQSGDLTKPVVRLFYSIPGRAKATRRDIDLSRDNADAIVSREEPRRWGFFDWDKRWPQLIRLG